MPIYEFLCRNCGEVREKVYKMSDRPNGVVCSNCGDIALVKPSLGSFHLLGGGWAANGYSKGEGKK